MSSNIGNVVFYGRLSNLILCLSLSHIVKVTQLLQKNVTNVGLLYTNIKGKKADCYMTIITLKNEKRVAIM